MVLLLPKSDREATKIGPWDLCGPAWPWRGLKCNMQNHPLVSKERRDYVAHFMAQTVDEMRSNTCPYTVISVDEAPELQSAIYDGGLSAWETQALIPLPIQVPTISNPPVPDLQKMARSYRFVQLWGRWACIALTFDQKAFWRLYIWLHSIRSQMSSTCSVVLMQNMS